MNRCLITGAELYIPLNNKIVHGDLHISNRAIIFNACLNEKGEAQWDFSPTEEYLQQYKVISFLHQYFERRGVLVSDIASTALNKAAVEYIDEATRQRYFPLGGSTYVSK